jgi:hypothetical protein
MPANLVWQLQWHQLYDWARVKVTAVVMLLQLSL